MSLVGTRPILPDELEQYELHHRARIAIKPGITGMWQVSGRSDITDFEEIVRLDTEYIQLLAETGIVGFLLMTLLIILMLFKTISAVKEKPVFWNILLIYWIILFGVYSFTGNTLYYPWRGDEQ